MLEDLATNLSTTLAVASMLFFVAVYIVVTIGVFRTGVDEHDVRARMALDPPPPQASEGTRLHDASREPRRDPRVR